MPVSQTNDQNRKTSQTSSLALSGKGNVWRPFLINLSLVVCIFVIGIFMGLIIRTNSLINNQILSQARAHFNGIMLTRRWNAAYNGVFVRKTEGVVSNPYLENPDIQTANGDIYTKKNPALMTREISQYAEKAGDFRFHITSLRPINPGNKPTEFESQALAAFENGEKELQETISSGERSIFTYMAPLRVEEGCLVCHAKQGYKIGDIRGGISVSFDVTDMHRNMSFNKFAIILLSALTLFVLIGVIYWHVLRLSKKLIKAYQVIEQMSVTDELTQIYNRRFFHIKLNEEITRAKRYRHCLSLILVDLDHFKKVNDIHGHQAGDMILREVSKILKTKSRVTDMVARYGGEELVILLPETDQSGTVALAEKLRLAIEEEKFASSDGCVINITASMGVSTFTPNDFTGPSDYDTIIKCADDALYEAKRNGRNRVESQECVSADYSSAPQA
ncbi:MAG: diguanylate cyclase [Deltaproteobacteria bacterium]|nr:diguanylate cyclase [Deltaproteobacteria bacterium]